MTPETHTVQVYLLVNKSYELHDVYMEADIAEVHVLNGCFLKLSKVFAE